jgi:hypothetical protein
MNKNIGNTDKVIRYILGAAIIIAGIYFKSWWGVIGIIPIATAAISWCPLYLPLGIKTCSTK